MYSFIYKSEEPINFDSAFEALTFFTVKGYGMQNWTILKDNQIITLEQFNNFLDAE